MNKRQPQQGKQKLAFGKKTVTRLNKATFTAIITTGNTYSPLCIPPTVTVKEEKAQ